MKDGYGRLIRHQQHQIIDENGGGGEQTADANKENLLAANVVGNPSGTDYVDAQVTHGTNGTSENSTLSIDITALVSALTTMSQTITSLQSTIADHETKIDTLETNVTALQATSADHETRIDALENA